MERFWPAAEAVLPAVTTGASTPAAAPASIVLRDSPARMSIVDSPGSETQFAQVGEPGLRGGQRVHRLVVFDDVLLDVRAAGAEDAPEVDHPGPGVDHPAVRGAVLHVVLQHSRVEVPVQ